ncbi:UNVERIFIED_CONTAM: hypothetical protein Scaly_1076500 [Sesamum calycinum]|uniref:MULE transposase domain-containing protein n=1 Tax=Sesamum calycinum TaxID=2727403 RepID=A0AAW2QLY9_9LAMI
MDRDEVERSDCEGQGVEVGVDDNFIEIPIQQEDSNKTENVTDNITENVTEIPVQNITEKGKRKLYERFLNESSSEFDDSSDEDYVQSGEGSDSETPSLVLEDIECDSDDDIFLLKDPSKKDLIKKLKKVLKDKKNRQEQKKTRETESEKHEWASEDETEDDLVSLEVRKCNPGSKLLLRKVENSDPPVFDRILWGQLLVAVGRDGNDNMFPIAMAVVQVENRDTWGWFVGELLDDIGGMGTNKWSFISDRQKAIGSKRARLDDYVDDCYTNQMLLFMKKSHKDLKPPPLSQEQPSAKAAARGRRQSPQTTQPPAPRSATQSNVAVHEDIPQGSQAPPPLSQEQPSAKAATQPPAPMQQQVGYQGPRNASLLGNVNPASSSVPATRRYNKRPSISEVLDKMKERQKRATRLVNLNACSIAYFV